jgi:NAD(P)-dependent dehydrogenase (short-subunit alcohol dehydrogenase family)
LTSDRFVNRVVLVTGAGQGIGHAIACAFGSEGATVAVNDFDEGTARATVDAILSAGGRASAWPADVSDEDAVEGMVSGIAREHERLDVVVNNAYWRAKQTTAHALRTEDFDRCMRVAVYGTFFVSRAAYPHLRVHGGSIVNLGSEGSEQPPLPGMVDYAAAKAGVRAISKALAREWGPEGIRVNTLWPNATTPLWNAYAEAHPEETERMVDEIALGRPGDAARDIAPVVLFLASDAARFMTGQTVVANGGRTML